MSAHAIWLASAFGIAVASALVPFINIEAYLLGLAWKTDVSWTALILAAATGQLVGKLALFWGTRYAREGFLRRRRARAEHEVAVLAGEEAATELGVPLDHPPAEPGPPRGPGWWRSLQAWVRRVCVWSWDVLRHGGWPARGVLIVSAAVGLPPLFATAVLAGATSMRVAWFAVLTWTGRIVRFSALLVIPLVLAA